MRSRRSVSEIPETGASGSGGSNVTAIASGTVPTAMAASNAVAEMFENAEAFNREYETSEQDVEISEAQEAVVKAEATGLSADADKAKKVENDRRVKAMMQGYTGDMCSECSNFTMVRNGTCLKCDTCGSTSGCS